MHVSFFHFQNLQGNFTIIAIALIMVVSNICKSYEEDHHHGCIRPAVSQKKRKLNQSLLYFIRSTGNTQPFLFVHLKLAFRLCASSCFKIFWNVITTCFSWTTTSIECDYLLILFSATNFNTFDFIPNCFLRCFPHSTYRLIVMKNTMSFSCFSPLSPSLYGCGCCFLLLFKMKNH